MNENIMNKTISYYNNHSDKFTNDTQDLSLSNVLNEFIKYLPNNAYILDFGCGAGRDTKALLNAGYKVDAIDGSEEMCRNASTYTGINVQQMLFDELNDINKYDGIWACASILHVPSKELPSILRKMRDALKEEGVMYISFKYGDFEGIRNNRYFTYLKEDSFNAILKDINHLKIIKEWITSDVRKDREEEKWLNLILQKK